MSRSSTAGQRAAIRFADKLGATIDTTASTCHAPSIMAIQEVKESTSSLGEIKNRAELVIFWGSNPVKSHPRHLERYSADPVGMFVPEGRAGRTIVVVDVEPIHELSESTEAHLRTLPTIMLDHPTVASALTPTVRFTMAVYGIHLPGTSYRMAEVPIPLRAFLPPQYPSDEDVVQEILSRISRRSS